MVQCIDSHRQEAARLDAVSVHRDVACRQPRDARGRRAQSQCLVQHLHGVSEAGHVLGRQLPVADRGHLGGHAVLHVGMVSQAPTMSR